MRTYRGFRVRKGGDTSVDGTVIVENGDDLGPLPMTALARSKSPSGFNWGYGGSGPAALAHSLLADVAGLPIADDQYQYFKSEVVAVWPQERDWKYTETEIREWLAAKGAMPL